ncbi:MAG: DUF5320 domain-containing protein [Kiritimatiellaeota bacterium]|nr:DUF5320 domain-containing protein [Kiritimatiellota bacterium]
MPRGDGTGPMGAGPMTGRSAGYCAGYAMSGFTNSVAGGMGLGLGRGRGFRGGGGRGGFGGFGFRNQQYAAGAPGWNAAPPLREWTSEEEVDYLDTEIKALENELKSTRERRGKISKSNKK